MEATTFDSLTMFPVSFQCALMIYIAHYFDILNFHF